MGINIFEFLFPDIIFEPNGNTQVCCPFPHYAGNKIYYETNPSAGIDISKNVFHCFSCDRGHNDVSFAAEYLNIPKTLAIKFIKNLSIAETLDTWQYSINNLEDNFAPKDTLYKLGISTEITKQLKLGYTGTGISIPIIINNYLLDVVKYQPGQTPKYIRRPGTVSGLICPFDIWKNDTRETIICAGEKDMLIARTMGFNAISFTGGEANTPELFLNMFKNRNVYIVYDNDETGRYGASNLALTLKKYAKEIHIVDISKTCTEKGGDVWDFFMKYQKTKDDFIKLLESTKTFTEEDFKNEYQKQYPLVTLQKAMDKKYLNKVLRSNIQVVAIIDSIYSLPTSISAKKIKEKKEGEFLDPGTERYWNLDSEHFKDIFYLIDSGLKEKQIDKSIFEDLLKIPPKESGIILKKSDTKPVYKCLVTDILSVTDQTSPTELIAYSIDNKLDNGKKYTITYKLVPHPQDGQKLVMVIINVEETDDFLDTFKITPEVKKQLQLFQIQQDENTTPIEAVKNKFYYIVDKIKGLVNADYNVLLMAIIDLWFHSALQIKIGNDIIRGYLDTLIVGESRIGKSSTVEALQKTYNLGKIVSLAGNAATRAGIIGGSTKVGNSYQTRAGIIPQNNKGAIIFEELTKCNVNIQKELTDIRSSNKVRIQRVNGTIEFPAYVRMLTLSNNKSENGYPKPISSYPNGINVLLDIIETAEDIARYDMIAVLGFDANKDIDPYFEPPKPFPTEAYQIRIRWIWSRKPEQIIISKQVYINTITKCKKINENFNSYIKIFGIEAWKKIIRLATAIAGYLASTDNDFENIIVNDAHVDLAIDILLQLYDNPTFRFKEFVIEERRTKDFSIEDINLLQDMYSSNSSLLNELNKTAGISRQALFAISGIDSLAFSRIINKLVSNFFITFNSYDIIPTEKFKKAMNKIDRSKNKSNEPGIII